MLTDIFSYRYSGAPLWHVYDQNDARFLVQAYRVIEEQIFTYYGVDKKENPASKQAWTEIHDRLSMELGLQELSPKVTGYHTTLNGNPFYQTYTWPMHKVCENFMIAAAASADRPDQHMKDRLSLVEVAFRLRSEQIESEATRVVQLRPQGSSPSTSSVWPADLTELGDILGVKNARIQLAREVALSASQSAFRSAVDELNERMRRAGYKLHYHNGFIQISDDQQLKQQLEAPFWDAVSGPDWRNVDLDMKEAIDRRDSGGKDPAFYGARALESTIKIISGKRGLTVGTEKGAQNYLDNLGSKRSGNFLLLWEKEALALFFSRVRNPLGHGPGDAAMPSLSPQQTDWAIGFCMSSIRSLICRL